LADIDSTVAIRLVTTQFGVRDVIAVSDLLRRQHPQYALIEVEPAQLHDRNMRVDNLIFTLGPGVDRAGVAPTNFGPADSSSPSHALFDAVIAGGKVVHSS
jgi:hypothetical protein